MLLAENRQQIMPKANHIRCSYILKISKYTGFFSEMGAPVECVSKVRWSVDEF